MYHNPETHTQQMVDSGINSGLPDFYHKNLTLLLPHHLTYRMGDEGPWDKSQHQHLTGEGVGRCKKTIGPLPCMVSWRVPYHPQREKVGSRYLQAVPQGLPHSPQAGHDRCASF